MKDVEGPRVGGSIKGINGVLFASAINMIPPWSVLWYVRMCAAQCLVRRKARRASDPVTPKAGFVERGTGAQTNTSVRDWAWNLCWKSPPYVGSIKWMALGHWIRWCLRLGEAR